MNVSLVDIDSKIPNVALMKASAWHKAQGDSVKFYEPLLDDNIMADSDVFIDACRQLSEARVRVKFDALDIRLVTKETAAALSTVKTDGYIHFAWAYPFVMPYDKTDRYQKDIARWANNKAIWRNTRFQDYDCPTNREA